MPPAASIVIPTRNRPDYLSATLEGVMPQAVLADVEVLVVSDGADPATARVAEQHGARLVTRDDSPGLNAARNEGIRNTSGSLIVFIDDDVAVPEGWLDAFIKGAELTTDRCVFGGPIHARLEGRGPRACGREDAPITTLDEGGEDCDVTMVWGANWAVRRETFETVGLFDENIHGSGDEEDWQRRFVALGGRVRYLSGAGLYHRRFRSDATIVALSRAAYHRGRAAWRYEVFRGAAPRRSLEFRAIAGSLWHLARRRCGIGAVDAAHHAGRMLESFRHGRGVDSRGG